MADLKYLKQRRFDLVAGIASKIRQDAYAAFQKTGKQKYRRVDDLLTSEVIVGHLSGAQPIAGYAVFDDQTYTAVLDLDDHDKTLSWDVLVAAARPICDELRRLGFKPLCCRSGGGSGLHIWLVWQASQPAKLVKQFLRHVLETQGFRHGTGGVQLKEIEVFPKNDRVKEGSYGNAVALPYSRSSVPLSDDLQPIDWLEFDPPALEDLLSPNVSEVYKAPPTQRTTQTKARQTGVGSGFGHDTLPGDEEEVRAALKVVEADDYDTWIRFGLALKHSLADDGFDIWNEWSGKSNKYEGSAACREVWDNFEPDGDVAIGTIFHMAKQRGWNGPSHPHIRRMNAQFAIYTSGKSTMIIEKNLAPDDLEVVRMVGKGAFADRFAWDRLEVHDANGGISRPRVVDIWMNHPLAAHVHRLDFDPDGRPGQNGKTWNVWSGFDVEPRPGDWSLMEAHIRDVVADGDPELNEWLLNWMALGVQQPGLVVGTAPVLMGSPGVGKGIVANAYGRLWGRHFLTVTHATHVQGNFSGHFFGKRFVFVDEGMFGGDRSSAGIIKTRMTEPYTLFERKGVDAELVRNHLLFMVASNEDSVVPADLADRRWQVLRVNDARKEDRPYFQAIVEQMENGGYEAMLCDLLHRDISKGPDPGRTIKNEGIFEQALRAAGPEVRYLFALLDEGELPQPAAPGNGPGKTTIRALYADMSERDHRARYVPQSAFGQKVSRIFPTVSKVQSGVFMERGPSGYERRRSTRYEFPELKVCRHQFETFVGLPVPWTFQELEWQEMEERAESSSHF
ncbi:hypothetical protein ACMU_04970 [Actibacterium mucosum KCTC 23349]|uniref:Uncharacterized protein n=1 Tax=Actibacterium mucosum KCTC 23349 TaxID=1454373 RepID=A0A037ZIN2_9RHOB|nr:PriCT-2 domain-containing protein [Actibacterium mucosum]KAJ56300.1 hypothetical protein ACMU_04970 [Actibacterium mucosum KCTC 23349]